MYGNNKKAPPSFHKPYVNATIIKFETFPLILISEYKHSSEYLLKVALLFPIKSISPKQRCKK